MREIKFRVYGKENEIMYNWEDVINFEDLTDFLKYPEENNYYSKLMQYTGLKDRNGKGCNEVYEYDIITIDGKIRGNIYEDEPRETDIVIPRIGTKAWEAAYKKALERGFDYAE